MITFIFECEYAGLSNGYGGENPADILARIYPTRILEIIERGYEDINKKFTQDPRLKGKYSQLTDKYN